MSTTEVEVLNTKLDILIGDFQSGKKFVIGFVVVVIIPMTVYLATQTIGNAQEIAILKATLGQ